MLSPKVCAECAARQHTCCQTSRVPMTIMEILDIGASSGKALSELFTPAKYDRAPAEPWWEKTMIESEGGLYRVNTAKKSDGSCVFLGPDGCSLCDRPAVCRIFPFWMTSAGGEEKIIYEPGPAICSFEKEGLSVKEGIALIGETDASIRELFTTIKEDCEQNFRTHQLVTKLLLEKKR